MNPDETRRAAGVAQARAKRRERFDAAFARTLFPAFSAKLPPDWAFFDNAGETPQLVFVEEDGHLSIKDQERYARIMGERGK